MPERDQPTHTRKHSSPKPNTPIQNEPLPRLLILPNQLAPVRRNDPVTQRRRDHARVPKIGPQDMATAAKRTKIPVLIRCQLAAANVIDMRHVQRNLNSATNTPPAVAFPDRRTYVLIPDFTRRSFSWHRKVRRTSEPRSARSPCGGHPPDRPEYRHRSVRPASDHAKRWSCPTTA